MENQQKIRKIQHTKRQDYWNGRKNDPNLGSVRQKSKFVKNFTDFAHLDPKIVKNPKTRLYKKRIVQSKKIRHRIQGIRTQIFYGFQASCVQNLDLFREQMKSEKKLHKLFFLTTLISAHFKKFQFARNIDLTGVYGHFKKCAGIFQKPSCEIRKIEHVLPCRQGSRMAQPCDL